MTLHGNGAPRREPFGQAAIRKGYVNTTQVQDALHRQGSIREQGGEHKLIGMIMLEMGLLGTTELIEILKDLNVAHHQNGQPKTARRLAGS